MSRLTNAWEKNGGPAHRGLKCPFCEGTSFEVDRVGKVAGSIRRVRTCKSCRRKIRTAETIIEDAPSAEEQEKEKYWPYK